MSKDVLAIYDQSAHTWCWLISGHSNQLLKDFLVVKKWFPLVLCRWLPAHLHVTFPSPPSLFLLLHMSNSRCKAFYLESAWWCGFLFSARTIFPCVFTSAALIACCFFWFQFWKLWRKTILLRSAANAWMMCVIPGNVTVVSAVIGLVRG